VEPRDGLDDAERLSLERLALAEWPEAAAARVVSVTVVGDRAEVVEVVNGSYDYWAYFRRDEHGWHETVEGNGPTLDWDAPSAIEW
jgi:hypothetical protein